jgi:hypothetical protein
LIQAYTLPPVARNLRAPVSDRNKLFGIDKEKRPYFHKIASAGSVENMLTFDLTFLLLFKRFYTATDPASRLSESVIFYKI